MTTDLKTQLRAVGNALDRSVQAVDVHEIVQRSRPNDLVPIATTTSTTHAGAVARSPRRRGASVLTAAAVLVAALVVGMALMARSGSVNNVASTLAETDDAGDGVVVPLADFDPEAALSTRTALSTDERVAPTWLPDGYSYQFARDEAGSRYLQFSDDEGGELSVSVIGDASSEGDPVEIDGRLWRFSDMNASLVYSRGLTGPNVIVAADQLDAEAIERVIMSLVVGGQELDGPYVLDSDGPYRQVAAATNGAVDHTLGVSEMNGWICTQFTTRIDGEPASSGAGCGSSLRMGDSSIRVLGYGTQQLDDGEVEVSAHGFASESVAEIVVTFSDDTSVSIAPVANADFENRGFWIASATIRPDDFQPLSKTTVQRVTAYDDSGNKLSEVENPFEQD